jgi:hypothetical protein
MSARAATASTRRRNAPRHAARAVRRAPTSLAGRAERSAARAERFAALGERAARPAPRVLRRLSRQISGRGVRFHLHCRHAPVNCQKILLSRRARRGMSIGGENFKVPRRGE